MMCSTQGYNKSDSFAFKSIPGRCVTDLSCGTENQYSCFLPCWAYCCMEALALETKVFFMGFPTRRHKNLWERGFFFSAEPGIGNHFRFSPLQLAFNYYSADTQQTREICGIANFNSSTGSSSHFTSVTMCESDITLAHIISCWLGNSTQIAVVAEKWMYICLGKQLCVMTSTFIIH